MPGFVGWAHHALVFIAVLAAATVSAYLGSDALALAAVFTAVGYVVLQNYAVRRRDLLLLAPPIAVWIYASGLVLLLRRASLLGSAPELKALTTNGGLFAATVLSAAFASSLAYKMYSPRRELVRLPRFPRPGLPRKLRERLRSQEAF
jgi:drug/metabolite transporter (DMT)-like permease